MAQIVLSDETADRAAARLKVPPHSVEAEQSVLGGLLLDVNAWDRVTEVLDEADFYRRDHRLMFAAMRDLRDRDDPVDVVTVSQRLDNTGQLDDVGGLAYLGELARNTPSAANIVAYAQIVFGGCGGEPFIPENNRQAGQWR